MIGSFNPKHSPPPGCYFAVYHRPFGHSDSDYHNKKHKIIINLLIRKHVNQPHWFRSTCDIRLQLTPCYACFLFCLGWFCIFMAGRGVPAENSVCVPSLSHVSILGTSVWTETILTTKANLWWNPTPVSTTASKCFGADNFSDVILANLSIAGNTTGFQGLATLFQCPVTLAACVRPLQILQLKYCVLCSQISDPPHATHVVLRTLWAQKSMKKNLSCTHGRPSLGSHGHLLPVFL